MLYTWFISLMRTFFYSIDKIIYNFIPTLYGYLIDIARTSVLSQADLASVSRRIYQLLTIFMVFKVIFSLIMYVVNPDDFSDKNKGLSKLGTNIIISLSILILTPYLFSYAFQLQTIILEDDSLGTLIFGDIEDEGDNKSIFNSAGDVIAYNPSMKFLVYRDNRWIESEEYALEVVHRFTDKQIMEAFKLLKEAENSGDKAKIDKGKFIRKN